LPSARDWRDRIDDIIEAASRILEYTADLDRESFRANGLVVDAVLRNFEVVGEAARNVPPDIEIRHPYVPWKAMRAMRNVLAHAYFDVDLDVVWQTIQDDIPGLPALLATVLDRET